MGAKVRSGGRFFTIGSSGNLANGWKIWTFEAGSAGVEGTDNKATFTDSTSATSHANPIILDSRGEKEIWWNGTYLIKVLDENDVEIYTLDYFGQGEDSGIDTDAVPLNPSFEIDDNGDGTPDNWTLAAGTNGTVAVDESAAPHGLKCLKFTGTDATGGGTGTSDKFPVLISDNASITYTYQSSAVDTLNKIDIKFYTLADALISTVSVMSEGAANPTAWATVTASFSVPATAVRAAIVLTGVDGSGTTVVGNTQFDNIKYESNTPELQNKTLEAVTLNTSVGGSAFLDEDDMSSDSATKLSSQQSIKAYIDAKTAVLNKKIIDIGDWNMDTTANLSVAHGLTLSKIRSITVLIREDLANNLYGFPIPFAAGTTEELMRADGTDIRLTRSASGRFDNTSFDSTSFNRGWIIIEYTD